VYDFDYMYTTNVREPVRADEKHLGRVKRHFVHTQVQTSSFELREISRYQVALKVSRTNRGVPLLEDIPIVGAVFRPAPSAESSIQQNIILGQTTVYPTLFDLMGLRWAPVVVDLDHTSLLDTEHIIRGRRRAIRDFVFHEAQDRVDNFLGLRGKFDGSHYRPDFYHRHDVPSPYHPGGYTYHPRRGDPHVVDRTGREFQRRDNRPPEMQEPPYELYRHRPVEPERVGPALIPERVPITPADSSPDPPFEPIRVAPPTPLPDNVHDAQSRVDGWSPRQGTLHRDPEIRPASFTTTVRYPQHSLRRLPAVQENRR
jgi:hypothetical protein